MTNWIWWLLAGTLSVLGGVVALANPFAATLTVEVLTGLFFLVIGALTLASAFREKALGGRVLAVLVGAGLLFLGFSLALNPLRGIVALTFVVASLLMIVGVFRILFAFAPQAAAVRVPLVIAGVISIVLGGMIFANLPQSSAVTLGILLAVELISNGVSMVLYALSRRSSASGAVHGTARG